VHPERYELVERIAKDLGIELSAVVGNESAISSIDAKRYATGDVGDFTLSDILSELRKPGRDPRATFEPPKFRDDVRTMEDLRADMVLEGVVTNVTAFGAFVDVGVHQDGLVHVSQLADRFVKNPSDVVKVGDKITVRVVEVDLVRKRIGLSARKDGGAKPAGRDASHGGANDSRGGRNGRRDGQDGKAASSKQGGAGQSAGQFRNNPFEKLRLR